MGEARGGRWHADPTGRWELRYWDGRRWTEHVQRRGYPGVDPIAGPHAAFPKEPAVRGLNHPSRQVDRRARRGVAVRVNAWPAWAKVTAAAVLLLILLIPFVASDADPERTVSADAPSTTSTAPPTTAPPTTAPTTTAAPTTTTTAPPTTAAPPPTTTPPTTRPPVTAPPATSPPATDPPTAIAPPDDRPGRDGGCDPNYSGCVPVARDVDCRGGRGDGPEYVDGPVRVIGRDIYDLDRNGDGIGCERR
jgi:hypothetical protein